MNNSFKLIAQAGNADFRATVDKEGAFDTNPANIVETLDNMWDGFLSMLPQIAIGVVVFIVIFFLAGIVRNLILKTTRDRKNANLGRVLGRLGQWVLILVGLLISAAIIAPSVKPGDLLAGLGIGGVAIGFAFKDILQNFLSGILILLREPFTIGDQIKSGDFEGTVEAIETRATIIKTYDGKQVVIPNSQIYTNPVVVNTAHPHRRSQYDVGVGCGDDIAEAARVIMETLKNSEGVANDPAPDVVVVDLADSSINLRARWWTASDQASVMKAKNEVFSKIKNALDDAGIDLPYPTQVHLFHDQTDEYDGKRAKQREGWPATANNPRPAREVTQQPNSRANSNS